MRGFALNVHSYVKYQVKFLIIVNTSRSNMRACTPLLLIDTVTIQNIPVSNCCVCLSTSKMIELLCVWTSKFCPVFNDWSMQRQKKLSSKKTLAIIGRILLLSFHKILIFGNMTS
jgi:hypothetical protein